MGLLESPHNFLQTIMTYVFVISIWLKDIIFLLHFSSEKLQIFVPHSKFMFVALDNLQVCLSTICT